MTHIGQCVNDTDGDGDCAACARNPNAPCRTTGLPEVDTCCVGCGEPQDNGQAHGYGAEFGGCV
ncbi:hypothetical protein ACIQMR_35275 [Streptomyces sp. NPDC091376]|uniref:hypothetical protein n=1 Tax=Streptomyces sp. NPDC091376 TaxID=3365994 RepID=UPI00381B3881